MKRSSSTALPVSSIQVVRGIPLSRLIDQATYHLCQLVAGNRDEDHASRLVWNVRAFERTRQDIADGKLPAELADHAGDAISALRTAVQCRAVEAIAV